MTPSPALAAVAASPMTIDAPARGDVVTGSVPGRRRRSYRAAREPYLDIEGLRHSRP